MDVDSSVFVNSRFIVLVGNDTGRANEVLGCSRNLQRCDELVTDVTYPSLVGLPTLVEQARPRTPATVPVQLLAIYRWIV